MKDIIPKYLRYTEQSESPTKYHLWSLFSVVAASVRRQVWLDMGFFKVFPNLFVVLVGPPGARKTAAIRIATDLVETNPDVHISADTTTWQAMVGSFKPVLINLNDTPYEHSSLTVVSEELSVFIGKENHELLSVLTNLYDNKSKWEYRTKNQGTNTIYNVWLNLLGATTSDWLSGSLPLSAIGGGFTSRIIFVVEDGPRHKTAVPLLTPQERAFKEELELDLARLSKLGGPMIIHPDAHEWYVKWYQTKKEKFDSDPRFSGYAARKHIHLLKVGMIVSLCQTDDLVITKDQLVMALELIEETEERMLDAFGSIGRSECAQDIGDIIQIMRIVGKISRKELLTTVWRNVSPQKFEQAMFQLREMQIVDRIIDQASGRIFYEYIEGRSGSEQKEIIS